MGENAIRGEGLERRYGSKVALSGVDIHIAPGEVVALVGVNGAGKSTLVELISGLTKPDSGEVAIFGLTPRDAISAGRVGTMLQDGTLLRVGRVISLLKMMWGVQRHPLALSTAIERAGVEGLLRKRISKLSGGEAQRVRYALAILSDPELLVLDEPTVGMDLDIRKRFWDGINMRRAQQTVLYTTHQLDEADRWADRVLVLNRGRIIADEEPARLRDSLGLTRVEFSCSAPGSIDFSPAVEHVETTGTRVQLLTRDSDATVRSVMGSGQEVTDLRVSAPTLEETLTRLLDESNGEAER
jgi:ABC-2 type transport system ATP-binding protein